MNYFWLSGITNRRDSSTSELLYFNIFKNLWNNSLIKGRVVIKVGVFVGLAAVTASLQRQPPRDLA